VRADAKRNRDRIVEVAREVFRERGYDASLDDIAKRAGVGPGTLYRHFPTRDALLDAVMQVWVDRVTETTDKALTYEGPTRDFLVGWFEAYVALISLHKGGPAKITSAMGDPASPIMHKCQVLTAAGKVLEKIPFLGPMLYLMGRQVLFFSPDQHNNFDHFSAGFTSFHRKEEIRAWYDGWNDVAVRYAGVANESIYARGTRP